MCELLHQTRFSYNIYIYVCVLCDLRYTVISFIWLEYNSGTFIDFLYIDTQRVLKNKNPIKRSKIS